MDGCEYKVHLKGLCSNHYHMLRMLVKHGGYIPETIIDLLADEMEEHPYRNRIIAALPERRD